MKNDRPKTRIADADLYLLIRTDKKTGAETLYDTYADFLFLAIIRIVGDRKLAEQVLEDTFRKVWYSLAGYDIKKERIYTWMLSIAKELAKDTLDCEQNK